MRLLKMALEPKDRLVLQAGCEHHWPCSGKPAIVFHDRGKIFTSERARQVLVDRLGIITEQAPPYAPSAKGTKELTDQGRLQYDHPLGLCLVAAGSGDTIPLKETLDLPDIMWLQFRRRMDKLEPFCRIAGHTSEEVRDILAALETVYSELFPQINLRQWSGVIYTWLTQPGLDPTRSGRVTMDYLMKLVTTALEWSYEVGDASVRAETLEKAAELLVLRRNTLRLIDGAGPDAPVSRPDGAEEARANGTEPQRETVQGSEQQNTTETVGTVEEQVQTVKTPKCTFSGIVSIDLERFLASSTHLVECPGCGRTRTLEPHGGVLRFKSHDKRKTTTPNTGQRWAMEKMNWDVVGG